MVTQPINGQLDLSNPRTPDLLPVSCCLTLGRGYSFSEHTGESHNIFNEWNDLIAFVFQKYHPGNIEGGLAKNSQARSVRRLLV